MGHKETLAVSLVHTHGADWHTCPVHPGREKAPTSSSEQPDILSIVPAIADTQASRQAGRHAGRQVGRQR